MGKYKYELAITVIGGILAIIELFLDINFGFFILSLTLIMDLALLGIRLLIIESLKENYELYKYIYNIQDTYWRNQALSKYEGLKQELHEMAKGARKIEANMVTAEELRLINQARKSIHCTYFADDKIKLQIRLNSNAKLNPMYAINTSYNNIKDKKGLDKKRIFILDKIAFEDDEVREILNELYQYYGLFGFETKFLLLTKMKEVRIPYVGNMILVDETECTVCIDKTVYPHEYINKNCYVIRELECNNIINPATINEYIDIFCRMWEIAVTLEEMLK